MLLSFAATVRFWDAPLISTLGALILVWGTVEAAYSFARYATVIPEQENVLGTGWYIRGKWVVLLLTARLLIGAALIAWRFL
jgi:hypothetical protein